MPAATNRTKQAHTKGGGTVNGSRSMTATNSGDEQDPRRDRHHVHPPAGRPPGRIHGLHAFRKPHTDADDAPSEGDEPGASTAEAGDAAAEGNEAQRYAELELRVARCEEAIGMLAESACDLTQLAKGLVEANGQITKALGMQCDFSKNVVEQTGLLVKQTESLSKGLATANEAIRTITGQ